MNAKITTRWQYPSKYREKSKLLGMACVVLVLASVTATFLMLVASVANVSVAYVVTQW